MEPARVQAAIDGVLAQLRAIFSAVGDVLDLVTGWITALEQFLPRDVRFITDFVQSLLQFLKDVIV